MVTDQDSEAEYRSAYDDVHPHEELESVSEGDKIRLVIDNDEPDFFTPKTLDGRRSEFIGEVVDDDVEPRYTNDGAGVLVRWTDIPSSITHIRRESRVGAHLFDDVWCVDVDFEFYDEEYYIADEFEVVSE